MVGRASPKPRLRQLHQRLRERIEQILRAVGFAEEVFDLAAHFALPVFFHRPINDVRVRFERGHEARGEIFIAAIFSFARREITREHAPIRLRIRCERRGRLSRERLGAQTQHFFAQALQRGFLVDLLLLSFDGDFGDALLQGLIENRIAFQVPANLFHERILQAQHFGLQRAERVNILQKIFRAAAPRVPK